MHIPTRYHIRILAGLSLSLAAALVSAGEPRPYQLGDVPWHALAPVDAYVVPCGCCRRSNPRRSNQKSMRS